MAGFPVFPLIEFDAGAQSETVLEWYAGKDAHSPSESLESSGNAVATEWKHVAVGFTFAPDVELVGHYLKVVCMTGSEKDNNPIQYECVGKNPISAGPGYCPFEQRQLYTNKVLQNGEQIRVVCYNILADIYASGEFARTILFPYCPDYAVDYHYRRQLLLKELVGYNSDLICLQECDVKCFEGYLTPALESYGFKGYMKTKGRGKSEGEAVYYRASKFSFLDDMSISIIEGLKKSCCDDIFAELKRIPKLLNNFRKRTTVMQVIVLKHTETRKIMCVVNTHLYYKPECNHIRLLQVAVMLRYIEHVLKLAQSKYGVDDVSLIVCGDLNSCPGSVAVDYLLHGNIPPQDEVWSPSNKEESGFSISLSHTFKLSSACGFPKFTNYVKGFQETLDYILISPQFKVNAVVPFPDEDEVRVHQALPSVVSPSDHLALVCDLQVES